MQFPAISFVGRAAIVKQLQDEVVGWKMQNAELQEVLSGLERSGVEKTSKIMELEEERSRIACNIQELQQEVEMLRYEKDDLAKERDEFIKLSSDSSSSKDKATIIDQKMEINKLKKMVDELRSAVSKGSSQNAQLKPCFAGSLCELAKAGKQREVQRSNSQTDKAEQRRLRLPILQGTSCNKAKHQAQLSSPQQNTPEGLNKKLWDTKYTRSQAAVPFSTPRF